MQLDGGAWTASTSPKAYANLTDASHTFAVRALDGYGNVSGATTRTWTVDAVPPPAPSIDSGPAAASTSGKNVSFAFSDTEASTTFMVQLDGGGYATETSPKAYTNLSDGSHTIDIVAVDTMANVSPVTSRTWTVDAIAPPTPTISSGPAAASISGKSVSFGFSDTEGTATFEVQIDGGGYSASTSPKAYSNLTQGSHTFDVRAKDAYGNTSASLSRTWDVDATPPTVSMTSPTDGAHVASSVTLTASANDTGGSGLAGVAFEYAPTGTSTWTSTPATWNTSGLSDGGYDLRAIAIDFAANSTTSALVTNVLVDNHAPTVTLNSLPYVNAADPANVTIGATSPDTDVASVAFYECSNASSNCSGGTWNLISTDTTVPFTASWSAPVTDGNRALRAVATDGSANTGANVQDVLIDRTAPSGGSVGYADGYSSGTSVTISSANGTDSGSGIDAASAALQRDDTSLVNGSCNPAFPGTWSTVTSPNTVVSGNCYRYRYRIADLAGNVATYTSANVVKVDTSAPTAVSLAFSGQTNTFETGGTVYFKRGGSGAITVTATSTDPQSGIQSTTYPSLGSGGATPRATTPSIRPPTPRAARRRSPSRTARASTRPPPSPWSGTRPRRAAAPSRSRPATTRSRTST